MQIRRYLGMAFTSVMALMFLLVACSPNSGSQTYDAGSGQMGPFLVALGIVPHPDNRSAFKLLAHAPGKNVDPATVRFCVGLRETCVAGEASLFEEAQPIDNSSRQAFLTKKYIQLQHDLPLTVIAKDKSGEDLTSSFTIVNKGQSPTNAAPPPPSDATAPNGGAGPEGGSPQTENPPPPPVDTATCYKAPDQYTCQVEEEIARLTNQKRATAGLPKLNYDREIAFVSRLWSREQANRKATSQEWFRDGTWSQQYLKEFGRNYMPDLENVVQAVKLSDALKTASALVELLWSNEVHKAAMLNPDVNRIGVGFAVDQGGTAIYVTQDFGTR